MHDIPKISIIIPTFNASQTLSVALDSIISQSFRDFEVLIIDGLSSDNTIEIANKFNDNRIRIISEKDKGIYDAMNKGIKLARGEWIYFLGSDDRFYDRNILDQIVISINQNNCDVIYGNVNSNAFNGIYDGEFTVDKILHQNICHQSIFFKKTIFKKTGSFNLKYKALADWDHNMHWFLSPNISKMYMDTIIAEYAAGGYSSIFFDSVFIKEKGLKYLIYGKSQFPLLYRLRLLKTELINNFNKSNRNYFIKLLLNIPRIILSL